MNKPFLLILLSLLSSCADPRFFSSAGELHRTIKEKHAVMENHKGAFTTETHTVVPVEYDLPSWKFNTLITTLPSGSITARTGTWYIEQGFQCTTITSEYESERFANFDYSKAKFRGKLCTNYHLYETENKEVYNSQLYICKDAIYHVYANAILTYTNKETR